MTLAATVKDLFDAYQNFQQVHPHIGTMLSSEFIFLASDASSQLIKDKKLNPKKLKFTAAMVPLYSLCIEGLLETGELVGKYISDKAIVKAALGPNFYGNFYNMFFFANNTIGEKTNYSIKNTLKFYYNTIKDKTLSVNGKFKEAIWNNIPKNPYYFSVGATLTFWNVFQAANYEYISEELRAPATLVINLFWTLGLTYMSLIGARKIAKEQKLFEYKNSQINNLDNQAIN
jgi:hypothetical protein